MRITIYMQPIPAKAYILFYFSPVVVAIPLLCLVPPPTIKVRHLMAMSAPSWLLPGCLLLLLQMYTLTLANVYSSSCSDVDSSSCSDVWHSNSVVLPNTVYRGTSTCSPGALIAAQSLNKGWSQSKQRLARHQSSCWGSRPFEGWLVARSTTILSINPLESLSLREPFHN